MTLQLTPKAGMILVRPIKSAIPSSPSGVIQLADVHDQVETTGEIVALAHTFLCDACGQARATELEVGDLVLWPPTAGTEFEWQGETLLALREADVQAIIWAGEGCEVV